MDLFDKCAQAVEFESGLRQSGHYCFFRTLESPQDAEVVVNGRTKARVTRAVEQAAAAGARGDGGWHEVCGYATEAHR